MMVLLSHHHRLAPLLLLLCAAGAGQLGCSSSDGGLPPPISTSGGEGGKAGSAASGGGSAGSHEGGAPTAGTSSGGEAGASGAEAAGSGGSTQPPGPARCSDSLHWSHSTKLPGISGAGTERLLAVTADELDLAFLRDGSLYVAHRALASAAFGTASEVVPPSGFSAAQGAALSANGLRLILVSTSQKELGELTRPTRDAAFAAEIEQTSFAAINTDAIYTGKLYASPALSPSDQQLFLNASSKMGGSDVVVSLRVGGAPWPAALQTGAGLLSGNEKTRRLPSGISADERTLFYFNEASQNEEARFRSSAASTSAFYQLVDLGAFHGATPNAACDRLYSDAAGDIVVDTH